MKAQVLNLNNTALGFNKN